MELFQNRLIQRLVLATLESQVMLFENQSVKSNGRNTKCEVPFLCFLLPRHLSVCLRKCM
jgi:hypothetical protein